MTGAISVCKVRGEVNPADIFTKHLQSRDKVHQLARLFGCEYRSGRAEAAPLLRPHKAGQGEGGHPSAGDALPAFAVDEAEPHDISTLPHLHSSTDIARLFPEFAAPAEAENVEDWQAQNYEEETGAEVQDPTTPCTSRRAGPPPGRKITPRARST